MSSEETEKPTEGEAKADQNDAVVSSEFFIPQPSFWREFLSVVTICSGQALVQACLAQGILPDNVISKSFKVGAVDGTWGPAAYGLTSGTFMLLAGRIGDIYGHRRCFVGAYAWFAISSLMTGLSIYSKSFIFYSVCRGLQGIASATLVPCALAILGSIYQIGPRKNLVFSFFAAGSPIGFTIGSVFSALLAQLAWWPWMFWITTIVCCVLGAISFFAIPMLPADEKRNEDSEGKTSSDNTFDWLGSCTGLAGLVLFNIAWNRAPKVGWSSPDVVSTLVTGIDMFIAFLFVERKVEQPLIPVNQLSKEVALVLATTALAWSSFGILIFYLVNFTLNFRRATLLGMAAQFTPVPFTGFTASYLTSFLLRKGFKAPDILAVSLLWFMVGNILLATLPVHQLYWKQAFWIYVLSPFGMDMSFPSATLIISQLVPPERQGIAASLVATVVYYSQSIGLGIAGTVQVNVAGSDPVKGYRGAAYTGIGLSGLGLLTALWLVVEQRKKKIV